MRVSSAGGVPAFVTTLDPATGETNHRWPHFLPDGRHFIYTASTGTCCPAVKPSTIRIASLDPAEATIPLFQAESSVSYASGHLLFARDETLMAQPRRASGPNAIGSALTVAQALIEGNEYKGYRKVIDLSADSVNSWDGISLAEARQNALLADIVINGLAVLCRSCSGRPNSYDLEAAFADRIIGGPGSFVVTADGNAPFAEAVRRKLLLEIAGTTPPGKTIAGR